MENSHVSEIVILFSASLVSGILLGFLIKKYLHRYLINSAKSEAQEILDEVKSEIEIRELEQKERVQEIEIELWTKVENEHLKIEDHIEDLQSQADEKKSRNDQILNEKKQKTEERLAVIKSKEQVLKNEEQALQKKKQDLHGLVNSYIEKLSQRLQLTRDAAKIEIAENLVRETQARSQNLITEVEEETKLHSEQKAKRILGICIERFARPYCPERGIGAVYFTDPSQRRILMDPDGKNIKAIEEVTGCDIIIEEGMDLIGVAGYDPVRRELTRRVLERLLKEKRPVNVDFIHRTSENIKRELFRQIKTDGDLLAKELKLENLHPEIRQMMGSLRHRYSFTQNQYFHCGEVGWLSGLIASEIGIEIKKARRIGMLHDIGKAMDHQLDGGHAVIGADFIQARNEAADVVHAVKAHHFDEQPSTDHAFTVIAADAISGARPGARRSTLESYNQKVSELQDIARSFEGVTDCFVLSGGRECRVMVNSKRIDDIKALRLSADIAKKIETECSYPGQIKVVVVRETLTQEVTTHGGKH